MILDANLRVTDAGGQDITGTGEVSTNSIDLNKTPPDQIGNGETIKFFIQCIEDFTGSAVTFELIEDAQADLAGSPVVLVSTGLIADADLLPGAKFSLTVPVSRLALRFLGINFNVAGTLTGSNLVVAGIVWDEQTAASGWPASDGFS